MFQTKSGLPVLQGSWDLPGSESRCLVRKKEKRRLRKEQALPRPNFRKTTTCRCLIKGLRTNDPFRRDLGLLSAGLGPGGAGCGFPQYVMKLFPLKTCHESMVAGGERERDARALKSSPQLFRNATTWTSLHFVKRTEKDFYLLQENPSKLFSFLLVQIRGLLA